MPNRKALPVVLLQRIADWQNDPENPPKITYLRYIGQKPDNSKYIYKI